MWWFKISIGKSIIFDFKQFKSELYSPQQRELSQDSSHEVCGIVVHSDSKVGYCHYYTFIKSFDGKQWFCMNDMRVLPRNGTIERSSIFSNLAKKK